MGALTKVVSIELDYLILNCINILLSLSAENKREDFQKEEQKKEKAEVH